MNYYQCIQLLPCEENPVHFLRNICFTKLHKALYTLKATDIGVSFPDYIVNLGNFIRVHGSDSRLAELQATNWLGGLSGYCDVSEIRAIPDTVKHRNISRIQTNMTASKLRRLIKRGSINTEEAKQYKAKMFTRGLDNPYLELNSASNGNKHRRYIQFGELLDKPIAGDFDQFGLSKTATIPWF